MRIIHTCLRYPPATGGVETYVHEIVERTRHVPAPDEERYEPTRDVRVLTSAMRTHGPVSTLDPETLRDDPMYVQRLHHSTIPFISYPYLQALDYYIGHHKPDIVHGYSFWYQPADTTARYAKHHHIPFIFHPMYYENDNRQKMMWQLYKHTIGKQTFAAADVVAVISPFEQSLITKDGFPVKRFELIPPGINVAEIATSTENIYAQRKITGTILLTVSRIAPGKGLEDAIAAFPDILKIDPSAHLVIVGEDFGAQAELNILAQAKGVRDQVHFLGKLSRHELISAYQHADLFIHPSHYEAFGITIAEALAAGTPVIARNTSAIPYVAPHNQAALLFNTQDQLVTHIKTLLENKALGHTLAQAGKERVTKEFSWDTSINKTIALYGELTNT